MPATEGVHSGNDARNGSCGKNGLGTMPANERVHYGNDARNGLYDKNGTGESTAFLKVSCGNDARNELYDKNGSGQQHPVWGFKNLKRCEGGGVRCGAEAAAPTYLAL